MSNARLVAVGDVVGKRNRDQLTCNPILFFTGCQQLRLSYLTWLTGCEAPQMNAIVVGPLASNPKMKSKQKQAVSCENSFHLAQRQANHC